MYTRGPRATAWLGTAVLSGTALVSGAALLTDTPLLEGIALVPDPDNTTEPPAASPRAPGPVPTSTPASADGPADESDETVRLLRDAILARLAVSYNYRTNRSVPALHCRRAHGGCETRVRKFAEYLALAASQFDIDPWVLAGMAERESGFDPFVVGAAGELGILQIHPKSPWGRRVRFIRDARYRKRCRREEGACQREVAFHAAELLSKAFTYCSSSLIDALGAYNTGRCGGNDTYARRVLQERTKLRRAVGRQSPTVRSLFRNRRRNPATHGKYLRLDEPKATRTL